MSPFFTLSPTSTDGLWWKAVNPFVRENLTRLYSFSFPFEFFTTTFTPSECVTVPSSYIIIRRRGNVCVTGNCQNIPRPANDRFRLRDGFVSSPFTRLVVADYAQLEMMILAHKSNDPIMVKAIIEGKDLHCLAVSLIFGVPYEEVIDAKNAEKKGINLSGKQRRLLDLRQAMKNVGYGIVYGIGAIKLGHDLTEEFQKTDKNRIVTEEEAQGYIDAWFNLFKTVRDFINYEKKYVKDHQFVQTFLRRFRRLPQIKSSKFKDRLQAERQAVNIIQGDAADIVKIAMLAVENDERLFELGYLQLLQVHDEIVGECPDEDKVVKEVKRIVKYLMEESFNNSIFKLRVPLKAEINDGYSWATAK
jgi:DNA polymerase-1